MNKSKIIVLVVVAVLVLGAVGYFFWGGGYEVYQKYQQQLGGTEKTITTPEGEEIKALVVTTGTSPISEAGKVINEITGKVVNNAAEPASPEAPKQSDPIGQNSVPSAIKITITSGGFTPNSFEVNSGAPVALEITSGDTFTHVFAFKDPSLSAVAVGLAPGETRAMVFNAPTSKGEYTYYCNVPGHEGRGEIGKMIVK